MTGGREDWRHQAACLSEDPELFFPIGTLGPAQEQVERARRVCLGCPVREPCLTFAQQAGINHGVWGGLGEDERRVQHRRRLPAGSRPRSGAGPRPPIPDPVPRSPDRGPLRRAGAPG